MDPGALSALLARRAALYDKDREEHYNLISALHKSLRGSDPDAALYWFARMLNGGEDPRYIARRLTRFAAEDIGMADPNALPQALAGWETYERLGSPEGELAIAQVVIYLATAPKSNAIYTAFGAARAAAKATGSLMPPAHILNAPTKLMQELGYGAGYEYDHGAEDAFSGQNYFPTACAASNSTNPRPRLRTRDRPAAGILGQAARRKGKTLMLDHVSVAVRNLHASADAYERVLDAAGLRRLVERPAMIGFGKNYPEFWLNARPDLRPLPSDTGIHICLRVPDEDAVRAFHAQPSRPAGRTPVLPGLDRRR